jgi:Putative MetA-pathway of phenol degradation
MKGCRFLALAAALFAALPVIAQEEGPIQDNSFLLEEAYNQGPGVVQHINTFSRDDDTGDWVYTLTQEWPAPGQRHQLSYTIPWQRFDGTPDDSSGVGDIAINYRLQLVGDADAPIAFSPRLTLLLPTGDEKEGLGAGAAGLQVNLPASVVLAPRFVTHFNLGATFTPDSQNPAGDKADVTVYSFGQSFVWLARPKLNALVEFVYTSGEEVTGPNATAASDGFFISPGLRWAYDFPSGLQIVPGIAVPLGAGPSSGERQVFFYLSFEHPFRRTRG